MPNPNDKWVILELSPAAENEEPSAVKASIRHIVRDAEVFLPEGTRQVGIDKVTKYLMDGYAFVKKDRPDEKYFKLEGSKFVVQVLTTWAWEGGKKTRKISLLADHQIDQFREQIKEEEDQGIDVGDIVMITGGHYKSLTAEVVADIPESDEVQVFIQLRSKQDLVTLPRSFLELYVKAEISPKAFRILNLGKKIRALTSLVNFSPDPDGLQVLYRHARKMAHAKLLKVFTGNLDAGPIMYAVQKTGTFKHWLSRLEQLMDERSIQIIIDGHNLAVRCAFAPGMAELQDKEGRPTGAIMGFLNTLVSIKKRFPEADVIVTWDKASTRRKALFSGYKATRGPMRAFFEISWLQQNLPFLGIQQAWMEGEEADDVVATLVQKAPSLTKTIIFSNDRDMLQLVTENVTVWVPSIGGAEEKFFTPQKVEEVYHVKPEQMVHLRAFVGDTSDEIPGVPGCGQVTAAKIIQAYGTAEKALASNLAGISRSIQGKIRAHENQVRLNLKLMRLIDNLDYTQVDPTQNQEQVRQAMLQIDLRPERYLNPFFPKD